MISRTTTIVAAIVIVAILLIVANCLLYEIADRWDDDTQKENKDEG